MPLFIQNNGGKKNKKSLYYINISLVPFWELRERCINILTPFIFKGFPGDSVVKSLPDDAGKFFSEPVYFKH